MQPGDAKPCPREPTEKMLCQHLKTKLVDYDMAMHDGRIVCARCGKFIRYWDAG